MTTMVKTTILLDDDIYRQLVDESIEKYGSTRKLSRLINERLRRSQARVEQVREKRSTIKLGRELKEQEIEKMVEEGWEAAVRWKR